MSNSLEHHRRVIVIGHGFTSRLGVVRSVGEMGFAVTVIVMAWYNRKGKLNTRRPVDCYSKYVDRYYFCYAEDGDGLVSLLMEKCTDDYFKPIIIPDSDFSMVVVDKNKDLLKDSFLFPFIKEGYGDVWHWMDKINQKTLARECGLTVANGVIISITDKRYVMPPEISYPCFTKPLATVIGGKHCLRRCDNEEDLRSVLDKAGAEQDINILVEEYKYIEKEYAALGFSNGKEVYIPGLIEFKESSVSHPGIAREGIVFGTNGFDAVIEQFKVFVKSVGYVGLFDIDFYMSGGKLHFCEFNLRFGGSGYAVTVKGVNLPAMFVKWISGDEMGEMQTKVSGSASYVNERMVLDDWYKGIISLEQYRKMIREADISFLYRSNDILPYFVYQLEFWGRCIKLFLKKFLW